jgi:hypothetical protein
MPRQHILRVTLVLAAFASMVAGEETGSIVHIHRT